MLKLEFFFVDIDSILQSLNQSNPGFEVVMSMDDIRSIMAQAAGAPELNNTVFGTRMGAVPTVETPGNFPASAVTGAVFGPFGIALEGT